MKSPMFAEMYLAGHQMYAVRLPAANEQIIEKGIAQKGPVIIECELLDLWLFASALRAALGDKAPPARVMLAPGEIDPKVLDEQAKRTALLLEIAEEILVRDINRDNTHPWRGMIVPPEMDEAVSQVKDGDDRRGVLSAICMSALAEWPGEHGLPPDSIGEVLQVIDT